MQASIRVLFSVLNAFSPLLMIYKGTFSDHTYVDDITAYRQPSKSQDDQKLAADISPEAVSKSKDEITGLLFSIP